MLLSNNFFPSRRTLLSLLLSSVFELNPVKVARMAASCQQQGLAVFLIWITLHNMAVQTYVASFG